MDELGADIREGSGIGIKPISPFGTGRHVAAAIRYAIDRGFPTVTLVHEGNIVKHAEGSFRDRGYEVARTVTYDIERRMEGATKVSTSRCDEAVVSHM